MRDHRAFLSAVPADLREAMTERRDGPGLRHLAGHLGLILVVCALIAGRVPGWGLLLPVQGVLIVFLFTLEHEATHRTPFRSVWMNDW
ncbi:MAG: fatty acid desaturase, partial [Tabrizicola sp.]